MQPSASAVSSGKAVVRLEAGDAADGSACGKEPH